MKIYFEEPELNVIQFNLKEDILNSSPTEGEDELPIN